MKIDQVHSLPQEFDTLIDLSLEEGLDFVKRTKIDWVSGKNTFNNMGEAFFLAISKNQVIGCGGINIDPYAQDPSIGRIRHLYVHPSFRRRGVAREITLRCINSSSNIFNLLRLRANQKAIDSYQFYESMGFKRVFNDENATHIIELAGF